MTQQIFTRGRGAFTTAAFSSRYREAECCRSLVSLGVSFLVYSIQGPLWAQDTVVMAETLFREGVALVEAGKFAEGCEKLDASLKLGEGLGVRLRLADCREKNGQLATAWAMFREASSIASAKKDDRAKVAEERIRSLEPRLSKVTVVVPPEARVDGLKVTRSGQEVLPAAWGIAVPVDGGEYYYEATAPNKKAWSSKITLASEKDSAKVIVELTDAPSPAVVTKVAPPPNQEAESPKKELNTITFPVASQGVTQERTTTGQTQRLIAYIVGGVGIASVGLGSYFGITAKNHLDASKPNCDSNNQCNREGLGQLSDAKTSATLSTIFIGAGLASVGAGVVLYVTAPSQRKVGLTELHVSNSPQTGTTGLYINGAW